MIKPIVIILAVLIAGAPATACGEYMPHYVEFEFLEINNQSNPLVNATVTIPEVGQPQGWDAILSFFGVNTDPASGAEPDITAYTDSYGKVVVTGLYPSSRYLVSVMDESYQIYPIDSKYVMFV